MISIQKLIDDVLLKKQEEKIAKPIVSWHIGGLGGCLRGLYLARIGEKPDEGKEIDSRTLRVFDVGNKTENWIVDLLKEHNGDWKFDTQVRVENKETNVSGYADLVATDPKGEKTLFEIKSKNSKAFYRWIALRQIPWKKV